MIWKKHRWRRFSQLETNGPHNVDLLQSNFVSCTIGASLTYAEAVKEVAQRSNVTILIEQLPDFLNQSRLVRGATVFGNPGDYFDRVAQQFENVHWTISERGLRFWKQSPFEDLSPFDRLAGELTSKARAKAGRKKLPASTYLEIAARLDEAGFVPLKFVEKSARAMLGAYNQKHAREAIRTFTAGLKSKSPQIRKAILRRLYRASEKYRGLAKS